MRTDGSFDWGIITANAQKWANSEYILEIEKDSLDTEEDISKKQTTPPLPYGIGVVSRVIRYQYFFTNILKATNIGLSPPILPIQPTEELRVLFTALFWILIRKHFPQNLFLWPDKIAWGCWIWWGQLLGSAWQAGWGIWCVEFLKEALPYRISVRLGNLKHIIKVRAGKLEKQWLFETLGISKSPCHMPTTKRKEPGKFLFA